ncbi:unnamed protein product [Haemonchus placei]|uniref:ULP_PROTEASE domain-containing protein n=2 Tax=Haemonchus TaxID=6288 RepID=A0A158QPD2_HAEPC|nr:unnamed protein product [Haemonchus placei]
MVSMKRDSSSLPDHNDAVKKTKDDTESDIVDVEEDHETEQKLAIVGAQDDDAQIPEVNPAYCITSGLNENDRDFALARLRCLGIGLDNVNAHVDDKGKTRKISSLAIKMQKQAFALMSELLGLSNCKKSGEEFGACTNVGANHSADCEKYFVRSEMLKNLIGVNLAKVETKIFFKVNEAFGSRLEVLSVEKVKKLLTYYKKKDDGSYDNIKLVNQTSLDDPPAEGELDSSSSPSRCESVMSEHGGLESDHMTAAAPANSTTDADQQLQSFIASLCSSPYDLSAVKSNESDTPHSPIFCDTTYQLKKERHDYVVSLAEHYMERMCFDSSSRSAQVNAERHNMWVKVAHLTNEKYVGLLNPLGVEQTKKLFSNCKRRRRLRLGKSEDSPLASLSGTSVSVSPDGNTVDPNTSTDAMPSLDSYLTSNETSPHPSLQSLVHDLDLTVEIKELRRQLAERDAEVARLKRKIVEQANDYKIRINSIADILKNGADRKVSEDIRTYLNVS